MYLHLGENVAVISKSIVAIIDLENSTVSGATKDFLKKAQKSGAVINVSDELPKSAIICHKDGKQEVFISQISTNTLQKRAGKTEVTI